jgi:UDPglucose 6-dehydrogenase
MSEQAPIGVIGVGWVGLVTATCFAELGHRVVAMDVDAAKVAALRDGEAPIHEPGIDDLLRRNRERLLFTTEIAEVLEEARVLFCCVDTPPTYSGDADLSRVQAVVSKLPSDGGHALVMKSTVPAGTGEAIRREVPDLAYVSCPEFLKEGTAVDDFIHPDRVVIGADPGDEWAADAVEAIYRPLGGEIVRTDVASAEMIKLAANAFLATKISFINEIANVCEEVGADVTEVARGMGLDKRIGSSFLRPGIGYGGSCFAPSETLLVRHRGWCRLVSFEQLWELCGGDEAAIAGEAIQPEDLEVWSWVPGEAEPEWMPASILTKRDYDGEMVEVTTKMGRRVRVTADHPFIVGDGQDGEVLTRVLAHELTTSDWLPLALGSPQGFEPEVYSVMGAIEDGAVAAEGVLVRPQHEQIADLAGRSTADRAEIFAPHPRPTQRMGDVKRQGALRLVEACAAEMDLSEAELGTARNGRYCPQQLGIGERFWRIVGLFLAEGCVTTDLHGEAARDRIIWSFHPEREEHLVDEVVSYWKEHGVKTTVSTTPTARRVHVSSRIAAAWWTQVLGCGRTSYDQRIPDIAWEQAPERKRALLSGLWEGDGSWSLINGGPSVILEWGTVSDELADGVARLLGELGIVCSWRRGRTRKSTKETHWLRVSGADQIERSLFLVPERHRKQVLDLIERQSKRIAPAGYRRFGEGLPWTRIVRVRRSKSSGSVYSLEVPGSHTVVTSGGAVVANCFPKDVSALKMLAGNTGYHFQLLTAVIEVNELQKRRVMKKLEKHLGSLVGKKVALLGLAFKPNTDDMREASSLVLAARLQGEGAQVRGYDPVAEGSAQELLPSVEMCESAESALEGAHAAILVTEWPEFAELDWASIRDRMATPLVIDGRNFLDPELLRQAGFAYEGIGRPNGIATGDVRQESGTGAAGPRPS